MPLTRPIDKMLDPTRWMTSSKQKDSALILVNRNTSIEQALKLAGAVSRVIVLDGAADVYAAALYKHGYQVDLAIGDGDSIHEATIDLLKSKGVQFHYNPDQYSNDFEKGLHYIKDTWPEITTVYSFSTPGGRADHSWRTLFCLNLAHSIGLDLYCVSEESIVMFIPGGKTTTTVSTPLELVGDTAGFLPLMGSSHITITGFEWDVEDWETSILTQLSTSNVLISNTITASSDKPLAFTVELRKN